MKWFADCTAVRAPATKSSEGLCPSDSPTVSLARRIAASLHSPGSLAGSLELRVGFDGRLQTRSHARVRVCHDGAPSLGFSPHRSRERLSHGQRARGGLRTPLGSFLRLTPRLHTDPQATCGRDRDDSVLNRQFDLCAPASLDTWTSGPARQALRIRP